MTIAYRRSSREDTPQICALWREHWGDDFMVVHGSVYRPEELNGFIALDGGQWVGVITFVIAQAQCEIVSLDSLREGQGIGGRLIAEVISEARRVGCMRAFLVTTNDNLEALGFYQKRGFELVAVHRGALNQSRQIKPAISLTGLHGIPLRDEIELEMTFR